MLLNVPKINASIYDDRKRALMERVARLNSALESEGTLHSGRPADMIGLSETVDILITGSRGYGPLKAVLLGGASGQVIRSAACPASSSLAGPPRPSAPCSRRRPDPAGSRELPS